MSDLNITRVWSREVLDSRGNPTVEAQIETESLVVTAIAPSGASTGTFEALELRDGGKRYLGKGVLKAVQNVREIISPRLAGMDATDLKAIDEAMMELDGTGNMARLGGNATTAVSFAAAKAGAILKGVELHEHQVRLGEQPLWDLEGDMYFMSGLVRPPRNVLVLGSAAGGALRGMSSSCHQPTSCHAPNLKPTPR